MCTRKPPMDTIKPLMGITKPPMGKTTIYGSQKDHFGSKEMTSMGLNKTSLTEPQNERMTFTKLTSQSHRSGHERSSTTDLCKIA